MTAYPFRPISQLLDDQTKYQEIHSSEELCKYRHARARLVLRVASRRVLIVFFFSLHTHSSPSVSFLLPPPASSCYHYPDQPSRFTDLCMVNRSNDVPEDAAGD